MRVPGPDGQPLSFDINSGGDLSIGKQFAPAVSGDYYLAVGSGVFGERAYVLDAITLRGDTCGPVPVASTHPDGADAIKVTDNRIVLTFDEPVRINVAGIVLRDAAGNVVSHDFSIGGRPSGPWGGGNQLFVKPFALFQPGSYTLTLPQGAVTDLAGNPYAGCERIAFSTVAAVTAGGVGDDLLIGGKGLRLETGAGIDSVQLPAMRMPTRPCVRGIDDGAPPEDRRHRHPVGSRAPAVYPARDRAGHRRQRRPGLSPVPRRLRPRSRPGRRRLLDHSARPGHVAAAGRHRLHRQPRVSQPVWQRAGRRAIRELLYRNVLYRLPEDGGYAFWMARLQEGIGSERVLAAFSESAENVEAVQDLIGNGFDYLPY